MKVCHIITGLGVGGTEMTLFKLLRQIDQRQFESEVISLTDLEPISQRIRSLGIPVIGLGMEKSVIDLMSFFRLVKIIQALKPDIVQTWMNHANFIGGLATHFFSPHPVIWNIRQSNFEPEVNSRSTILAANACSMLSYFVPKRIICGSEAAFSACTNMGYDTRRMEVIPNGFELDEFKPDPTARTMVRQEIGVSEETVLIGLVARIDPQKNHQDFIRAASIVHKAFPQVKFLLCGTQVGWDNRVLVQWLTDCGVKDSFVLLGARMDVNRIFAALDIYCSSSCGEGFPNVVAEAMACEVPCVVTDVGDSALIVGDCGKVVPPYDTKALGGALIEMVKDGEGKRRAIGQAARRHVGRCFPLPSVARKYEVLYKLVAKMR
jgi:glycosyltransferase involved in cell wall biosynthesis